MGMDNQYVYSSLHVQESRPSSPLHGKTLQQADLQPGYKAKPENYTEKLETRLTGEVSIRKSKFLKLFSQIACFSSVRMYTEFKVKANALHLKPKTANTDKQEDTL